MGEGLPWWSSGQESARQCSWHKFDPWYGKTPHAREQRNPCATPTEPAAYSPCSATWEKPLQWGAHTPQESPPRTATRERPGEATKTQCNQNKSSQINKWGGLKQLKTIKKIITSFIYCWLPWVSLAESGLSLAAVHRLFTAVTSLVADQGL